MKIAEMAKLAKKDHQLYLYDEVDEYGSTMRQFVGDGHHLYPMEGMPLVDEKSLLAIIGITQDKVEGWNVGGRSFGDASGDLMVQMIKDATRYDTPANEGRITINYAGVEIVPVFTQKGIYFIQAEAFRPIKDIEGLQLMLRETEKGSVIVAMQGLILKGVFAPIKWESDELCDEMQSISNAMRSNAVKSVQAEESEKGFL